MKAALLLVSAHPLGHDSKQASLSDKHPPLPYRSLPFLNPPYQTPPPPQYSLPPSPLFN